MATLCLPNREFLMKSGYASEEATYLEEQENDSVQDICRSNYLFNYEQGITELLEIVANCCEGGWDGYDAVPVSVEVLRKTFRLLEKMPTLGIQRCPEIVPENDGAVTLEWHVNPKQELSVSVNPNNVLYYAFVDGSEKQHGSCFMQEGLPPSLVQLIEQIMDK